MNTPEKFGIWITQRCPMRCSFCPNSDEYFKKGKVMPLDVFKDKVDEIASSGITNIDLTPIIGEVLTISNLNEYLDYLDSKSEITEYTFITCLVCPEKNIDFIISRSKLKLEISFYGVDAEKFKARTNRNAFDKFLSNLKYLISNYKFDTKKIVLINRTLESLGPIPQQKKSILLDFLIDKCHIDNDWVTDRDNVLQEDSDVHACHFMTEPLLTEKGICFCCMDWNKKYIVDSKINDFYGDSNRFISKIRGISNVCNKQCGWYRPLNKL
jgi:hypothetical protein